jgi:putative endonuclease
MASKKEVGDADPRRALGKRGEDLAADFFIKRGYAIIARNWRRREGEIDLIVQKGDEVRIVEVKARRSLRAGLPEESVTDEKMERINDLANLFFQEQGMVDPAYHIDVCSIIFAEGRDPVIRYFPDAE